MTIPEGYTLATWFNGVVGDLSAANSELAVFEKYWASFTVDQQTLIKTLVKSEIDAAIVQFNLIKAEIDLIV